MIKSKTFVRILAVTISMTLAVSMLTGCGGKPKDAQDAKTSAAAADASVKAEKKEPVKLVYFRTTAKPPAEWEIKATHDYILEASGYDIEWITAAQGTESDKLNIIFASKDNLDLVERDMMDYKAKGLIQSVEGPLKQYGQAIMNDPNVPGELWKVFTDKNGKIWGMPRNAPIVGNPIMYRKDWMAKLGLSIPNTIEEYENVLKVMKEKDPAGNGQTVPMAGEMDRMNICFAAGFTGAALNSIAGGNYIKDAGGNFINVVQDPGYKEFVGKLADWYKKGYIYKENFGLNITTFRELINKNVVATTAEWISGITLSNFFNTISKENPEADYVWNPKGIRGPKGLCETMPGFSTGAYVVPIHSKKAEDVVKYMNWVYSDPEHMGISQGYKIGDNAKWVDKSKGLAELTNGKVPGDYNNPMMVASDILERKFIVLTGGKANAHQQKGIIEGLLYQYDRGPKAINWEYIFDSAVITKDNPNAADINRAVTENITKFIMGVRPMSEYDAFLADLKKMGIDQLNAAITKQYKDNNK